MPISKCARAASKSACVELLPPDARLHLGGEPRVDVLVDHAGEALDERARRGDPRARASRPRWR